MKWDLVDVEDVRLRNSEYSARITGLISFLLRYCIECKNLVLEILKHDKIWGGAICISVDPPHSKFWETRPRPSVI